MSNVYESGEEPPTHLEPYFLEPRQQRKRQNRGRKLSKGLQKKEKKTKFNRYFVFFSDLLLCFVSDTSIFPAVNCMDKFVRRIDGDGRDLKVPGISGDNGVYSFPLRGYDQQSVFVITVRDGQRVVTVGSQTVDDFQQGE